MPALKWTEEAIRQEALKFSNRSDFMRKSAPAYQRMLLTNISDSACAHMGPSKLRVKLWDSVTIPAEAKKYDERAAFKRGAPGAYRAAIRHGILAEVTAHMPHRPLGKTYKWDLDSLKKEALKYRTRSAFKAGSLGAFIMAERKGWRDEVSGHMERECGRDNDTVYIWKAPGEYFNGKPVYKIGVTSKRLGEKRIRWVSKDAEIIILQPVQGKATDHEAVLHILGDNPQYVEGNGHTEFRALSDSELQEAIQYIEEVAA